MGHSFMRHSNIWSGWKLPLVCILGLLLVSTVPVLAQYPEKDISQISLEELSKTEVTSVSKKEQKLSDAASAVYVITQSDIRRSTATSLPELLHGVPGLDVAQINGNSWAISSRGFAEQYSTKMLILIDGRNVFDPLFSGANWSEQDLPLEDIERIEIIRGPGSTMWGTNAMNGVINIITKPASETQGVQVSAGTGSNLRSLAEARYGGRLGKSTEYRVFGKYHDDGPETMLSGQPAHDSDRLAVVGLRADSRLSDRDTLMFEANGFNGSSGFDRVGFSYTAPFSFAAADSVRSEGENVLAQWQHQGLKGTHTTVQADYSRVLHEQFDINANEGSVDVSVQHEMPLGSRHDVLAGLEYQFMQSDNPIFPNAPVSWSPANQGFSIASGFIQDEILFRNGKIRLTGGLRIERNSLSGFSLEPSLRGLWKVARKHSFWAAYSDASRAVSLTDTSVQFNVSAFPGPAGTEVIRYLGNPDIKPEKLQAFELGYRAEPNKKLTLDVATYYNRYTDLDGGSLGQPFFEAGPPPRLVLPLNVQAEIWGTGVGGELSAKYQLTHFWQLRTAYSLTKLNLHQLPSAFAGAAAELQGQTPRHKMDVSTSFDLSRIVSWNILASFVDRRMSGPVPAYTQIDSSLTWRPVGSTRINLGVQNLLNKEHFEFVSNQVTLPSVLGRSVYAKVTWGDARK
jgi:iron complex outermembrane receptor protein